MTEISQSTCFATAGVLACASPSAERGCSGEDCAGPLGSPEPESTMSLRSPAHAVTKMTGAEFVKGIDLQHATLVMREIVADEEVEQVAARYSALVEGEGRVAAVAARGRGGG